MQKIAGGLTDWIQYLVLSLRYPLSPPALPPWKVGGASYNSQFCKFDRSLLFEREPLYLLSLIFGQLSICRVSFMSCNCLLLFYYLVLLLAFYSQRETWYPLYIKVIHTEGIALLIATSKRARVVTFHRTHGMKRDA